MNVGTKQRAHARRTLLAVAIVSALLAVAGCDQSRAGVPAVTNAATAGNVARTEIPATSAVAIKNFVFQPATLTIAAGSKVVWINRDEEPHLVVSAGAQFPASPALDTGDSYTTVFAKPGTYTYFCSIHPHMVGTIVVK